MIGRPVPKRGSVRSVFARSGLRNTLGGAKLTEIAKLFGVTPQAVRNIKNQKNYRYIHNNPFQGLLAANENSKRRA